MNISRIVSSVSRAKGIDIRFYKRDMLERRIMSRMNKLEIATLEEYSLYLNENPDECGKLIDEIGINYSVFFRDLIVFNIIEQTILPDIIETKRQSQCKDIRTWSVGCSQGEEAYSLAILIHRFLEKFKEPWTPFIFGTDIDSDALDKASEGIYPRERFESTPLGILDQYFIFKNENFVIKPFIRNMVHFSIKDCTTSDIFAPSDSIFASFDLVLCRNVLIYFNPVIQEKVMRNLCNTIIPGGFLILGDTEILFESFLCTFRIFDKRNNIYRKI